MELPQQVQEFDWDDLLYSIASKEVIPIVGKELLQLSIDGEEILLEQYLARSLAKKLRVPGELLPANFDINAVAMVYERTGGEHGKIYTWIKRILDELDKRELPLPESLQKLAKITDFTLYVTTTCDSLLLRAINEQRFQGRSQAGVLAHPRHGMAKDLPWPIAELPGPYVYYLFGKASTTTDYVLTDEDHLEQVRSLLSDSNPVRMLFDEFRNNHLLFIGCGFEDWFERFLIRTIRNEALSAPRTGSDHIADRQIHRAKSLTLFLQQYKADLFLEGGPNQFVSELYENWKQQRPASSPPQTDSKPGNGQRESRAVFISYASEDREAAENIYKALKRAKLDAWIDKDPEALKAGSDWESALFRNIRNCIVFMPLISRNTQRPEGVFRKEWNWALKREEGIGESWRFIQPVVIDDTPNEAEGINDQFWKKHVMRFPGGIPDEPYLSQLTKLVREIRLQQQEHGR